MRNGHILALVLAAPALVAFGVLAEKAIAAERAYDYEACDAIVQKLDHMPWGLEDLKEATKTPGGNWCIKLVPIDELPKSL